MFGSDWKSLVCQATFRSCYLSLWEAGSQFLKTGLVNAICSSIAGSSFGMGAIEPSFAKASESLLVSTSQWLGIQSSSIVLNLKKECKQFLHSRTIFEVIKGLNNVLNAVRLSLQTAMRLSFNFRQSPTLSHILRLKNRCILSQRKNPLIVSIREITYGFYSLLSHQCRRLPYIPRRIPLGLPSPFYVSG